MPILTGQSIDARHLEQATGAWPPRRFVSMCNALVWATSGRTSGSFPDLTERINAADGGIDGQWTVDVPEDDGGPNGPLLSEGWNVFQYKQRDLLARDRSRTLSDLRRDLMGAGGQVIRAGARDAPLSRYTLFTNIDLKGTDKDGLRESIRSGSDEQSVQDVQILGAAELAALLHSHPHLAAAFFRREAFLTWDDAYDEHVRHKLFGADVPLIGRDRDLRRADSLLSDARVRAVVISGPHDSGKTRFALEATRSLSFQVVFVTDPRSMAPADYRALCSQGREVICVVDDPDRDALDELISLSLSLESLKLLITQPIRTPPSHTYGDRVGSVHLKALSEPDSRQLLGSLDESLDFAVEDWIIQHAGGLPGVAIAAAHVAADLHDRHADFAAAVGAEAARRIEADLGSRILSSARVLSLLTHVGISGDHADEFRQLCDVFGDVRGDLEVLVEAGIVIRGGSFVTVALPLLADHLAAKMVRELLPELLSLFARLSPRGRYRLLARMAALPDASVVLWDDLCSTNGLFGSLDSALQQGRLLRLVASSMPDRVLKMLQRDLCGMDHATRLGVAGDQRRELVWSLQQLLFRRGSSAQALKLLCLLAEAENEECANNATGVLIECFHPVHPQMPLSLAERLSAAVALSQRSEEGAASLAIRTVVAALSRHGTVIYTTPEGHEPFDPPQPVTVGECRQYHVSLVKLLVEIGQGEGAAASEALQALPDALSELGIQTDPEAAIAHFGGLVDAAVSGDKRIDVSRLVSALTLLRQEIDDHSATDDVTAELSRDCRQHMRDLDGLLSVLEQGSFSLRLRRWAGSWPMQDDDGSGTGRFEKELGDLADNAASNADTLSDADLAWLLAPEASRAGPFFFLLGRADAGEYHLRRLLAAADTPRRTHAVLNYWAGWKESDPDGAESAARASIHSGELPGEISPHLIAQFNPDDEALQIIDRVTSDGTVQPGPASRALNVAPWLTKLSPSRFADLLQLLRAANATAADLVPLLVTWQRHQRSFDGRIRDIAWSCLEEPPVLDSASGFPDCDLLAGELARLGPDRGRQLLESTLRRADPGDDRERWSPLCSHGGTHRFWDVLGKAAPEALLSTLLRCGRNPEVQFRMSFDLRRLLDQEEFAKQLIGLGTADVESARVVASWLTAAKPQFWPIAFRLIEAFPHDATLTSHLVAGIEREGSGFWGPISDHYAAQAAEMRARREAPDTPPVARLWLTDLVQRTERHVATRVTWEYDLEVDDLRHYIAEGDSAQRAWALSRVLKYASWEQIRRLLTVDEIEEALPQIDLPDKKRQTIERALPIWRHAV